MADDKLVLGPAVEGGRVFVRKRGDSLETGVAQIVPDGKPLMGCDLVQLTRSDVQDVYDVTTLYEGSGPAKVTSNAYREGWDRIFSPDPAEGRLDAPATPSNLLN